MIAAAGMFLAGCLTCGRGSETNVFGVPNPISASLMGVFYDLKQTQTHKPTNVTPTSYTEIVEKYLTSDWDERIFSHYYQVPTTLYATQIFIPDMRAEAAPKAFRAGKTVQPSRWIIHYKGQVSPPSAGSYRFWASADDVIAVAVGGKTVLVMARGDMKMPNLTWKSSSPDGAVAANGRLRAGDWMNLRAGQIIDLDIIIGERPGGYFNAFLMVEKKGQKYPMDSKGSPILPIFQLAPYNTPVIDDVSREPKFSKGYPIWTGYQ